MQGFFNTADVAQRAGVHKDTLFRWLRSGKIPEPVRDDRGWRLFTEEELNRIIELNSPQDAPDTRVQALAKLDWDFDTAKTGYLTHGLHPYPAKFIPQIPNALIQELSAVGETVCDIFCGSGTTLVEGLILKRNVVGLDANPLACLICDAKTCRLSEGDAEVLLRLVETSAQHGALAQTEEGQLSLQLANSSRDLWRPSDDDLLFWFPAGVVEELAQILHWCSELPATARTVAHVAFSSIVVAVSKQDSDTRYVRREKNIKAGECFIRFSRSLQSAIRSLQELNDITEPRFRSTILQADLLANPDIPPVDLVVCSPPYPNAFSYHLYHRTRMLWLRLDQKTFKSAEIGSHRKYSRKGASIETFRSEMEAIFRWLSTKLRKGGYACFVVGSSTIGGKVFNNADILSQAGRAAAFSEKGRFERTIKTTSKAFNPAIGKIKTETILVLRNS